jgi:hypothetical protein
MAVARNEDKPAVSIGPGRCWIWALGFALVVCGIGEAQKIRAFPGAQGFGAYAQGGRGGKLF